MRRLNDAVFCDSVPLPRFTTIIKALDAQISPPWRMWVQSCLRDRIYVQATGRAMYDAVEAKLDAST